MHDSGKSTRKLKPIYEDGKMCTSSTCGVVLTNIYKIRISWIDIYFS